MEKNPIPKQVKCLSFEEKFKFYDKWYGSVDHQIWLMNCGYKFGYPECCIFEFIQDSVIEREIKDIEIKRGPRSHYIARYKNSLPNQFWIPCYYCIK